MAANYYSLLTQVSILIMLLICSLHIATGLQPGGHGGSKTTQTKINSTVILRELLVDFSTKEKQHYRTRTTSSGDRISPGGPDPQHNSCSPALPRKALGQDKCRNSSTATTKAR